MLKKRTENCYKIPNMFCFGNQPMIDTTLLKYVSYVLVVGEETEHFYLNKFMCYMILRVQLNSINLTRTINVPIF